MQPQHSKKTIERAIRLYQDGKRIVDIEKQTGVGRASLYHALNTRGLVPNRNLQSKERRRAQALRAGAAQMTNETLLAELIETQRELADARAVLAAIRRLLAEATADA